MDKKNIRKKIKLMRDSQTQYEIKEKSRLITEKLVSLEEYKKAETIFVYVSFGSEVQTHNLIKNSLKNKKRIGVPVTDLRTRKMICSEIYDFDKELQESIYGILEPKPEFIREIDRIDLVVVPCVAFDKNRFRVGYGGGFYDRFLADLGKNVPDICLAYELQRIEKVPVDKYDIQVKKIITEENEYAG